MATFVGDNSKIQRIVRIRQMLLRWRKKACRATETAPSDVPAGHLAVCVGMSRKRFIVRASYLNHPIFRTLLLETEEEYGFCHQGPIVIPCDESDFEGAIRSISRTESGRFWIIGGLRRRFHVDLRRILNSSENLHRCFTASQYASRYN